jgi:hypothetical protein
MSVASVASVVSVVSVVSVASVALALSGCELVFPPGGSSDGRPSGSDASGDGRRPDGLTGHDEDGDQLPDVSDPCPHLFGDGADNDRDGVGDACDPHPDESTSSIVLFTGFDTNTGDLESAGNVSIGGDVLRVFAASGEAYAALSAPGAYVNLRVWTHFRVTEVGAGPIHMLALLNGGAGGPTVAGANCRISELMNTPPYDFELYADGFPAPVDTEQIAGELASAEGDLVFTTRASSLTCTTMGVTLTEDKQTGVAPGRYGISVSDLDVELDYVFAVATDDL